MKKLFILLLTLLTSISLFGCQKRAKYVIGVCQFAQAGALDDATKGFVDTLKTEFGDEVDIIVNNALGVSSDCVTIVNGFIADGVDMILANATPVLQAASAATTQIPILGTSITEYGVALGLEDFNGVVGTNVSGTSDLAPLDQQGQMILDLLPQAKKVGIIFSKDEPNSLYQVKVMKEFLAKHQVEVLEFSLTGSESVNNVVQSACEQCDALFVPTDNTAANNAQAINNIASVAKTPIIAGEKAVCAICGVASLSIDYYSLGQTTAQMAIEILKGEKDIKNMAIQYDPNPVKVFNPEIAQALNIAIPSDYVPCN